MVSLKILILDDEKVFIITVDTPFIKYETIKKLIDYSNNFEITIAQTPFGTHNLCGVFSKIVLSTIEEMLEENIHKINLDLQDIQNLLPMVALIYLLIYYKILLYLFHINKKYIMISKMLVVLL